jgi:glyoxylase-like metal-dependent hydrolase (beta-lactamase superfamily II)
MRSLGREDLKLIFITHAHLDHYGSAAALRRATGADIVIHREDASFMARGETPLGRVRGRGNLVRILFPLIKKLVKLEPTPPDLILEDSDFLNDFGLDGFLVHTPGHTPGSSCLFVEGSRLAFSGDLVTNSGHPRVQSFYAHDWSKISGSLARLQGLKPDWTYPGHGKRPIDGDSLLKISV